MILALEVALIMKRLMYQRWKGFHLVRHAQFWLHIALNLVVQNQTVSHRILVITLITADFQISHYKMSKKSGSSHVSQVFICVPVYFFVAFLLCTWKSTRHQLYVQYYVLIHVRTSSFFAGED